ncbi:3'-5' exonuclease [Algoriphagus halophilus]|uniref:3'-5' exonuclease n=1 Tax=Algoriphagus halophilus TaxID=226505 RepID=UPI00358E3211
MTLFLIVIALIVLYFIFKKKKKPEIIPNIPSREEQKTISIGYDDSDTGFKHYMVFDTETDGLPIDKNGDPNDLDNWPRIVQLCWMILDSDFKLVEIKDRYIKVNFEIDPEAIKIHGITNEKTETEGVLINEVMEEFLNDLETTEILVAHNLDFDVPIIDAELLRLGKKEESIASEKYVLSSMVLELPDNMENI